MARKNKNKRHWLLLKTVVICFLVMFAGLVLVLLGRYFDISIISDIGSTIILSSLALGSIATFFGFVNCFI
jgi:hypothetical protein